MKLFLLWLHDLISKPNEQKNLREAQAEDLLSTGDSSGAPIWEMGVDGKIVCRCKRCRSSPMEGWRDADVGIH